MERINWVEKGRVKEVEGWGGGGTPVVLKFTRKKNIKKRKSSQKANSFQHDREGISQV